MIFKKVIMLSVTFNPSLMILQSLFKLSFLCFQFNFKSKVFLMRVQGIATYGYNISESG